MNLQEFITALKAELMQPDDFLTEEEAANRYKRSPRKLQQWRQSQRLVEGIHYIKVDGGILYIPEMMRDRLLNWNDEEAHLRAIKNWRAMQLSHRRR